MLVVAGLLEYRTATTPFRKTLVGGFIGFHVVSLLQDFQDGKGEAI